MSNKATCFVGTMMIWLLLTWSVQFETVVAGAFFSLLIAMLFGDVFPKHAGMVSDPRRWFWFIIYVPYFLYYCVEANLDVAYRVLHPDVPIRPGIVKVRSTLKGDVAKTMLANSITLTPGTLTVDIVGQDYYVHWIRIPDVDTERETEKIIGRFEWIIRKVFE